MSDLDDFSVQILGELAARSYDPARVNPSVLSRLKAMGLVTERDDHPGWHRFRKGKHSVVLTPAGEKLLADRRGPIPSPESA